MAFVHSSQLKMKDIPIGDLSPEGAQKIAQIFNLEAFYDAEANAGQGQWVAMSGFDWAGSKQRFLLNEKTLFRVCAFVRDRPTLAEPRHDQGVPNA
jgi:hypothetical protein